MKAGTLALLIMLLSAPAASFGIADFSTGKVAVVKLSGEITSSRPVLAADTVSPEDVRELNERAVKKGADAIVYEINSGGGAVVASKEIMREIESVEVTTVCRFRDVAASGAYLAALGCDRIVADSVSLTGSIGVKSSYLEFSGLLRKLGVENVNVTSGRYKDIGSRYRNITPEEKELLRQKTERIHREFVQRVVEERNLTQGQKQEISTGEPFLGERARQLGLVDSLGGRRKAVDAAEELTGKSLEVQIVEQRQPFSIFSLLSSRMSIADLFSPNPIEASIR